ncbi:MAG: histidine kinase [Bacteroidota bacterium]
MSSGDNGFSWMTLCLFIGIGCFLTACESDIFHEEPLQAGAEYDFLIDSLQIELRELGIDRERELRLLDTLRPVLFSDVEEFAVESWYVDQKINWLPDFDTTYVVYLCSELLFQQYLKAGDSSSAARIKLNMGWIHFLDTDYVASIETQEEVLELTDSPYMVAWAVNNIGAALCQSNQMGVAKGYFEQVLAMPSVASMPGVRANSLMNMAIVNAMGGNSSSALSMIDQAKKVVADTGLELIENSIDLNLSFVLLNMGRFDEAIVVLEAMPGFSDDLRNRDNIFLNANLAAAWLSKGDCRLAEKYIERAWELSEALDLDFGRRVCWSIRAKLYEALGRFDDALHASRENFVLEDDQEGAKTAREIASLSAKLKLQEKDAEIEQASRRLLESEERSQSQRQQIVSYSLFLFAALVLAFLLTYFKNKALVTAQQKSRAEAKLQLLQTQMSPHFLFNALGGIQNYILKSEKAVAYSYLGQFGSMLRNLAESTDQVEAELNEEIEFIKNYLELEKLRFREEFNYSIVVNEALSREQRYIPSMVIQPIVENAMIHGLAGLERKGLLLINISPYRDGIRCKVTDNGRGRVAAAEISKQTGQKKKHLSISSLNTQSRLECLRKIGYENAHLHIEDLYENGQASGTEVTIYLPFMNIEN